MHWPTDGLNWSFGDAMVMVITGHKGPRGGRPQLVLMRHPPPAICQNLPGGGGSSWGGGGGGRRESGWVGGGLAAWPRGGGLRATRYYHMHTSRGCLGAWGYRGMYAIIAISCLCQEESLKGLKDSRHSTPSQLSMGPKNWRLWRHGPRTAIFQNWGGRGGGGGLGGVAYKDRAWPPPWDKAGLRCRL